MRERPSLVVRIAEAREGRHRLPPPERETRSDTPSRRFTHRAERTPMDERMEQPVVTSEAQIDNTAALADLAARTQSQSDEEMNMKTETREAELRQSEIDERLVEIHQLAQQAPPRRGHDTVKENPQLVLAVIALAEDTSMREAARLTGYAETAIRGWKNRLDSKRSGTPAKASSKAPPTRPSSRRPAHRRGGTRLVGAAAARPKPPMKRPAPSPTPTSAKRDDVEAEIAAMAVVVKALEPLPNETKERVLDWVYERFLGRSR